MKIDGRALAGELASRLRVVREQCDHTPSLGIFMIAPTPETRSFVRIKQKRADELSIRVKLIELPEEVTQEEASAALRALCSESDGVVVQQPLPVHIDNEALCALIPPEKDVDALTPTSVYRSPVVCAVATVFAAHGVDLAGKRAVVLGSGKLVGAPVAAMLMEEGAQVTIFTKITGIDVSALQEADIVVSGTGKAGLVTKDMLSPQAVVIDAGTSESRGAIVGDVSPDVYDFARLVSPVPGGIGPLTVMCLFQNLLKSASCSS